MDNKDMPQCRWVPGPYSIEHVEYFSELPGLEGGTFEISSPDLEANWLGQALTIEQATLFAASPALYEALTNTLASFRALCRNHPDDTVANAVIAQAEAALAASKCDPRCEVPEETVEDLRRKLHAGWGAGKR